MPEATQEETVPLQEPWGIYHSILIQHERRFPKVAKLRNQRKSGSGNCCFAEDTRALLFWSFCTSLNTEQDIVTQKLVGQKAKTRITPQNHCEMPEMFSGTGHWSALETLGTWAPKYLRKTGLWVSKLLCIKGLPVFSEKLKQIIFFSSVGSITIVLLLLNTHHS